MFRLISGILVIILSTYGIGFGYGENEKRSLELLLSLKRMLYMLSGEIKYSATPLYEAFLMLGEYENEYWAEYFRCVTERVKNRENLRLGEILKEEYDRFPMKKYMKKPDENEFIRFGYELGCYDRASQLGRIDLYIERISLRISEIEKNLYERIRLYRILGLACGILIIILVI